MSEKSEDRELINYIDQIDNQQNAWKNLSEKEKQETINKHEQLESEVVDEEESLAVIKQHLIQHNENKKKPAYIVRGAELMCNQGTNKRMMNLSPCHGVYIKTHAVVHELDCIQGDKENITWFGVCMAENGPDTSQIQLVADDGKECNGKKCNPQIIGTWLDTYDKTKILDNGNKMQIDENNREGCNTVTIDSFLVCKYGGIIMPISSGQDREVTSTEFDPVIYKTKEMRENALKSLQETCIEEIDREDGCNDLLHIKPMDSASGSVHGSLYDSKEEGRKEGEEANDVKDDQNELLNNSLPKVSQEGLMALMELEIFNEYSLNKGYLVIEDNKLVGIKPHDAGDGKITVGFGDCLDEEDVKFYQAKNIRLSANKNDMDEIKDIVIPTEICFEKFLLDVEEFYKSLERQVEDGTLRMLSQQEVDALVIIKYQCYSLGEKARDMVNNNEGRDKFSSAVKQKHGRNGNFDSRTNTEMNIYYDGNYDVEGGLGDEVIIDPWKELCEK